jgi:hypothetical protein
MRILGAALVAAFLLSTPSLASGQRIRLSCGLPICPPVNPAPAPSKTPLTDTLKKLKAGGANLIGQLQTIEWQATQPFPGTNPPAPWDPYAAACMPALISFIQSTPTEASVPTPPDGMATGPLVTLYGARLDAIALDQFVTEIGQVGFPPPRYRMRGLCSERARASRQAHARHEREYPRASRLCRGQFRSRGAPVSDDHAMTALFRGAAWVFGAIAAACLVSAALSLAGTAVEWPVSFGIALIAIFADAGSIGWPTAILGAIFFGALAFGFAGWARSPSEE